MRTICPHCHKPIEPNAIQCQNCGSHLVEVEEKPKRLHLYTIPIIMVVLLAGVVAATIFFRNRGDEFREIREKEREVPRQIDQAEKAKRKAQSDQEAQAAIARYQQMEAEREKRRKDIEELEAWRALPAAEKRALLDARFRPIESRLKGLQERTSAGVTPELKAWLEKMDSRLQAVHMFFEAGQLDQAKGLIEGLQKDLDAMLGPTAQPPQDDGKGAAGASPGAGSGTN